MSGTPFTLWLSACRLQGPDGLRERVPETVTAAIARFRDALSSSHAGLTAESITPEVLEGHEFSTATDAWSVYLYLRFQQRYELLPIFNRWLASRYSLNKTAPQVVSSLQMDKRCNRWLAGEGIRMACDLLHRGWNPELRQALARKTGMPYAGILTLTKGCDVCRMTGMMGKTLFRCRAMGYDTLDAFRRVSDEKLKADLQRYLNARHEKTSVMIDYAWFPRESNVLPDLVEYEA